LCGWHLTRQALGQLERRVTAPESQHARPMAELDELGVRALIDSQRPEATSPHERQKTGCQTAEQQKHNESEQEHARQRQEEWARRRLRRTLISDIQELLQLLRSQTAGVRGDARVWHRRR
jgi:hypothetical protein